MVHFHQDGIFIFSTEQNVFEIGVFQKIALYRILLMMIVWHQTVLRGIRMNTRLQRMQKSSGGQWSRRRFYIASPDPHPHWTLFPYKRFPIVRRLEFVGQDRFSTVMLSFNRMKCFLSGNISRVAPLVNLSSYLSWKSGALLVILGER